MFFTLSTFELGLVLVIVIGGAAAIGLLVGRWLRNRGGHSRETLGVVQGTLLGFLGLLLAFGLTMAVGRYEGRRQLVVQEANDIGTAYLRAQLLAEPMRTESMDLLKDYTDAVIAVADQVPETAEFRRDVAAVEALQNQLWKVAGDAVRQDPTGTAPRLYVDTLNETIDTHGYRVASLHNRVPSTVMVLQVVGSAVAIGVLALYLALLGRGAATTVTAAAVVILILFIAFDLDRPQRGLITVPYSVLEEVRQSMDQPPAAEGP